MREKESGGPVFIIFPINGVVSKIFRSDSGFRKIKSIPNTWNQPIFLVSTITFQVRPDFIILRKKLSKNILTFKPFLNGSKFYEVIFSNYKKHNLWWASANASSILNDSCNLRGAGVTNAIFKGEVGTEQLGVAGWSTSEICWSTRSYWPPWVLGPASSTTAF